MANTRFVVVAVLVLSGISIFGQTNSSIQSVETAIRQQQVALAAAMNRRDAAAVAEFFAPDGDEVFFDHQRVVGANAIRQNQQKAFATWVAHPAIHACSYEYPRAHPGDCNRRDAGHVFRGRDEVQPRDGGDGSS